MNDLISRTAVLDLLKTGEVSVVVDGTWNTYDALDKIVTQVKEIFIACLEALPSAQPEKVNEQIKWERDIAVQQLQALGYGLGEKIRTDNDTISRVDAIDVIMGQPPEPHYPSWYAEQIKGLPSVQPEIIRCKNCQYCKDITPIYGECESPDMWSSLFGEVTEVETIEVHKDHYCGYAERRTDDQT